MDSEIVKKTLISLGVAGGAGGSGVYMFMPKTRENVIVKKLAESQYKILTNDSENASHWQAILNSYKSSNGQGYLQFDGFSGNEDGALGKLQKLCHEITKPFVSSNKKSKENYKKAEKWCVEPVSVISRLEQLGIKALNLEKGNKETNSEEWKQKVLQYKKNEKKLLSSLWFERGNENQATEGDIVKIKETCKGIGDQKNHNDKYAENLENFKTWCTGIISAT